MIGRSSVPWMRTRLHNELHSACRPNKRYKLAVAGVADIVAVNFKHVVAHTEPSAVGGSLWRDLMDIQAQGHGIHDQRAR